MQSYIADSTLAALAKEAKDRDIFLICYEGEDKSCHRKLLLKIAKEEFGADIDPTSFKPEAAKSSSLALLS